MKKEQGLKEQLPFDKLVARDQEYVERICSDEQFAYTFLHDKCRPLISKILWTMFGNDADYDDLVNDLYLHLKKPGPDGLYWHNLRTFDYKTSLFHWIKTVAVRLFYTPNSEIFEIPQNIIESGLAEQIILEMSIAQYRKLMWLNYIEKKTKEEIISLIGIHENEYSKVSRQAIKSFKSCVKSHFPDYYDAIFTKKTDGDTIPIDKVNTARITQKPSNVMAKIDVERYLSLMPNDRYRKVLKSYFLDGLKPEEIAKDLDIKVDNVYNLKLRGLDQIRDIIIFSGEIENIERYIKEVSNDRNYEILYSLFVRKMSYESISTSLGLSENAFKKAKRCAINDLRRIIFKS